MSTVQSLWEQLELARKAQVIKPSYKPVEFDYSTNASRVSQIKLTLGYLLDTQLSAFDQIERMIEEEL